MSAKLTQMLSDGTQTLPMRDIYEAHCRCGRSLYWEHYLKHADITATAECVCGMAYTAWLPTIKIEGVDRTLQ